MNRAGKPTALAIAVALSLVLTGKTNAQPLSEPPAGPAAANQPVTSSAPRASAAEPSALEIAPSQPNVGATPETSTADATPAHALDAASNDTPHEARAPSTDTQHVSGESAEPSCQMGGQCEIDDLRTPPSPAFSFIGVTPESVVRPSTPRALALALYNAFGGNSIPDGFALEVAPCWLYDHPLLTYDAYRDAGVLDQLWHNFSASVATAKVPLTPDQTSSMQVGIGVRTNFMLYSFQRSNRETENEAIKQAEDKLMQLDEVRIRRRQLEDNHCTDDDSRSICSHARERLVALKKEASDEAFRVAAVYLQAALQAREGIAIEFAGALGLRSPSDRFSLKDYTGAGVWLTTGYESSHWNLLALGRYTSKDIDSADGHIYFVDIGGRVGVVVGRFGVHFEALHRFVHAPAAAMIAASERVAGTVELRVSDDVYASASFGKDANTEAGKGGVIALAGLSLQAGSKPKVTLQK